MVTKETTRKAKERFLKALEETLGIKTAACDKTGIHINTVLNWMHKDEAFVKRVDEIQEKKTDFVESCFLKNVKAGDVRAQIFYMKCFGKKRGYIENQNVNISGEINALPLPKLTGKDIAKLKKINGIEE